jgi:hypothetical protein
MEEFFGSFQMDSFIEVVSELTQGSQLHMSTFDSLMGGLLKIASTRPVMMVTEEQQGDSSFANFLQFYLHREKLGGCLVLAGRHSKMDFIGNSRRLQEIGSIFRQGRTQNEKTSLWCMLKSMESLRTERMGSKTQMQDVSISVMSLLARRTRQGLDTSFKDIMEINDDRAFYTSVSEAGTTYKISIRDCSALVMVEQEAGLGLRFYHEAMSDEVLRDEIGIHVSRLRPEATRDARAKGNIGVSRELRRTTSCIMEVPAFDRPAFCFEVQEVMEGVSLNLDTLIYKRVWQMTVNFGMSYLVKSRMQFMLCKSSLCNNILSREMFSFPETMTPNERKMAGDCEKFLRETDIETLPMVEVDAEVEARIDKKLFNSLMLEKEDSGEWLRISVARLVESTSPTAVDDFLKNLSPGKMQEGAAKEIENLDMAMVDLGSLAGIFGASFGGGFAALAMMEDDPDADLREIEDFREASRTDIERLEEPEFDVFTVLKTIFENQKDWEPNDDEVEFIEETRTARLFERFRRNLTKSVTIKKSKISEFMEICRETTEGTPGVTCRRGAKQLIQMFILTLCSDLEKMKKRKQISRAQSVFLFVDALSCAMNMVGWCLDATYVYANMAVTSGGEDLEFFSRPSQLKF